MTETEAIPWNIPGNVKLACHFASELASFCSNAWRWCQECFWQSCCCNTQSATTYQASLYSRAHLACTPCRNFFQWALLCIDDWWCQERLDSTGSQLCMDSGDGDRDESEDQSRPCWRYHREHGLVLMFGNENAMVLWASKMLQVASRGTCSAGNQAIIPPYIVLMVSQTTQDPEADSLSLVWGCQFTLLGYDWCTTAKTSNPHICTWPKSQPSPSNKTWRT